MRGRSSATSLFRLVLCAGFLCVAWMLLSPGEAQAAEQVRPDPVSALTGTPAHVDTTSRPVTRGLRSVDTATTTLAREGAKPVREARRHAAATPTTSQAVRPVARPRLVPAAVGSATTEVGAVVRGASSRGTATLTAATASVPVVHEPVDRIAHTLTQTVTQTLRAVTDGVRDLGAVAVPVPVLPQPPTDISPGPVVLPMVSDARPTGGSPAERVPGPSRGLTNDLADSASWDTRAPAHGVTVAGATGAPTPVHPGRDGAPGGMPPATAPSGASVAQAGGHGASADGVAPWTALDVADQQVSRSRGDDSASRGPADRPGSRPD